ncbi:phenol hydroxylase [Longibacter salinarum]|uniref:Phenol hydroxylase n=1 Tax=Longibacter salinarum TaxID=1850348 RepID=A0A2A8CYE4_9BACT|nr:FAD-dependent oxidoreductase [Longibacter salinarum]PEN13715.1 phenol hydroxylase [Longibacter salinarum]
MRLNTLDATLIASDMLTPNTAQLVLRVPGHQFDFEPGHHVGVAYESDEDGIVHKPYSPVSLPGTDTITLMVKRYDDGTCSVWLHERALGDTIPLTDPRGNLQLHDTDRDAVFLATGTGLTPMMSMLQAYRQHGKGRAVLVYGERSLNHLAYRNVLDMWTSSSERIDVAYVLSEPESAEERAGWTESQRAATGAPAVRHGHVQEHLDDLLDSDLRENAHFFACGVPQMVVDTEELLTDAMDIDPDRIFTEGWESGA